jgi:hypothetical protein
MTTYKILRKSNNEILSCGLTKDMVDYLVRDKKWPLSEIEIIPEN